MLWLDGNQMGAILSAVLSIAFYAAVSPFILPLILPALVGQSVALLAIGGPSVVGLASLCLRAVDQFKMWFYRFAEKIVDVASPPRLETTTAAVFKRSNTSPISIKKSANHHPQASKSIPAPSLDNSYDTDVSTSESFSRPSLSS
jgi:hypothetical protein